MKKLYYAIIALLLASAMLWGCAPKNDAKGGTGPQEDEYAFNVENQAYWRERLQYYRKDDGVRQIMLVRCTEGSNATVQFLYQAYQSEQRMGSPFDFFGEVSHPYCKAITEEQYNNRMILQRAMVRNGFKPLDCEWWHFTLENEPYPNTYFEFPVASAYLKR